MIECCMSTELSEQDAVCYSMLRGTKVPLQDAVQTQFNTLHVNRCADATYCIPSSLDLILCRFCCYQPDMQEDVTRQSLIHVVD